MLTVKLEWLKSNLKKIYYSENYDNIRLYKVSNIDDNEKKRLKIWIENLQ